MVSNFVIKGFYFVLLCIFELRTQHGCERTHGQTGIAGALMDHSYEAYNILKREKKNRLD